MIHRKYGSSTAARTNACPAWAEQSEGVPRKESSYAVDGDIVHGLLEHRALGEPEPDIINGHKVEPDHREMAADMWAAMQTVLSRYSAVEWEPEVHAKVSEDIGGTLDMVIRGANVGVFADYKSGRGVQVSAVGNAQILFAAAMMLFGESSSGDLVADMDDFVGVILQPSQGGDIIIKEWEFTRQQVADFWDNHQKQISLAEEGGQIPSAGDHCKFCPANGLCDATTGNLLRMQQLDPEDLEQLAWALDHMDAVEDTLKAVKKLAIEQLEVGANIPGWKLVPGRAGALAWDDPDAALPKLKRIVRGLKEEDGTRVSTLFEKKAIITPTQAKALLKKHGVAVDFLDEITHNPPPGKNVLAPASDKREAVLSPDAFAAALNSVQ